MKQFKEWNVDGDANRHSLSIRCSVAYRVTNKHIPEYKFSEKTMHNLAEVKHWYKHKKMEKNMLMHHISRLNMINSIMDL